MERIEKDCGALIMDEGRIFDIDGALTDNGEVFKDLSAFESGAGICYVSEDGLGEIREELSELQAVYENTQPGEEGYLSDKDYRTAREEVITGHGYAETRKSIIQKVRDFFGDEHALSDAQVEAIAKDVFGLADWADICTYLQENIEIDSFLES